MASTSDTRSIEPSCTGDRSRMEEGHVVTSYICTTGLNSYNQICWINSLKYERHDEIYRVSAKKFSHRAQRKGSESEFPPPLLFIVVSFEGDLGGAEFQSRGLGVAEGEPRHWADQGGQAAAVASHVGVEEVILSLVVHDSKTKTCRSKFKSFMQMN